MNDAPAPPLPPPAAPVRASGWRRFAIASALGALAGFVLFCVFGPGLIGWWYAPPGRDALSCGPAVAAALGEFVKLQLGSAVGGAVILLVLMALFRSLIGKVRGKPAPAPPAPPAITAPEPPPGPSV